MNLDSVKQVFTGVKRAQSQMRQLQNRSDRALACTLIMPAIVVPAVLPVVVLFCFLFVGIHSADGQALQREQEVEYQKVEIQQLVSQLAEVDFDQREAAERTLVEIGSPAVEPLLVTLLDCKPDVCSRVKRILQSITSECDEESLFKVLAALRIRFEVPNQRINVLLDGWAVQRRAAVVARWRQQGVVVIDPSEGIDLETERARLENQLRFQLAQQQRFKFDNVGKNNNAESQPIEDADDGKELAEGVELRSISERLKLVLDGSVEQNKRLVMSSKKGAAGFEESIEMLQKRPVSITIGENWQGEFADFEFANSQSNLSIGSLTVQKKEINDSLLSSFNKHPIESITFSECPVAADITETLPTGVSLLVIESSQTPNAILNLISADSSELRLVRFVSTKFGKTQAVALSDYPNLAVVELEKIDLESDAFDGLALLRQLQRVGIERCKFPSAAFLEFREKRGRELAVDFLPKAFLGVSSDPGILFRRNNGRLVQQPAAEGCMIATVVPGEAADRAGMEAGDQVLEIGDQKIKSFDELRVAIAQCEIGEKVAIKIRRGGEEKTLQATMGTPEDLK